MQIIAYFSIVGLTLTLLGFHISRSGSKPLAAIFLFLGMVQGLVFKPLLLMLSGYDSFVGAYILGGVDSMRFWLGGTYIAFGFFLLIMLLLGLELCLNSRSRNVGIGYYKNPRTIYFDTLVCLGFAGLALIALIFFLISAPELVTLGGKNSLSTTDLQSYTGSGVLRLIINFSNIIVFLMIHNLAVGARPKRSKHIASFSALIYLSYAVLSDQRALIFFSVLSWGLFIHMTGFKFSRKKIVSALVVPISLVFFTSYRRVSTDLASNVENFFAILANFAGQNFIDITKTILIFDAQYVLRSGSTFLDAVLILIPRSIFPEKETVNIDTLIASEIYGNNSIGSGALPPGMIGEMMFNFGLLGIPLGLTLSVLLIWLIDFYRYRGRSFYLMFYTMALYSVGVAVLGSSFQSTFLGFLMVGLPLFVLHLLSLRRLSAPLYSHSPQHDIIEVRTRT